MSNHRRRTPLGGRRRRDRVAVRRPAHDTAGPPRRAGVDHDAARHARRGATFPWCAMGGGGERTDLVLRLPVLRGPVVRSGDEGVPAGLRRPGAVGAAAVLDPVECDLRARGSVPSKPQRASHRHPAARARADRVLALHLASAPALDHGWLAALHDRSSPRRSRSCTGEPARKWTVAELASRGGRLALAARRALPRRARAITHLGTGRSGALHLAQDLLATSSDLGVHTPSRGGSDTTRRRRSAARSSERTDCRRAIGGWLAGAPRRRRARDSANRRARVLEHLGGRACMYGDAEGSSSTPTAITTNANASAQRVPATTPFSSARCTTAASSLPPTAGVRS